MRSLGPSLLLFGLCLASSCNKESHRAQLPAYVKIDQVDLQTDLNTEGSAAHKITTVWVQVDGAYAGVFELPAIFPVLASGSTDIRIQAGINENGTSATRLAYPFYEVFETQLDLTPLDTHSIQDPQGGPPSISYRAFSEVEVLEDFDGVGLSMEKSPNADTLLYRTNDSSHLFHWNDEPNDYSGVAYLGDRNTIFEVRTEKEFSNLPKGAPVFLEINYKSDVAFVAGMYVNSASQGTIQAVTATINPSDEWNKIYINLYSEVNGYPNVLGHKVFIGAINYEGQGEKTLFLDNIKLLY